MWANIYLVLQLKVFEVVYNRIAVLLSKWENHKYHRDYYNSHLWKQVFFQFVNYYVPFFYLAVQQRMSSLSSGCPDGGCLAVLQRTLNLTLALLGIYRLLQITYYSAMTHYRLKSELALASTYGGESPHSTPRFST